jgi:hypothetical protein
VGPIFVLVTKMPSGLVPSGRTLKATSMLEVRDIGLGQPSEPVNCRDVHGTRALGNQLHDSRGSVEPTDDTSCVGRHPSLRCGLQVREGNLEDKGLQRPISYQTPTGITSTGPPSLSTCERTGRKLLAATKENGLRAIDEETRRWVEAE